MREPVTTMPPSTSSPPVKLPAAIGADSTTSSESCAKAGDAAKAVISTVPARSDDLVNLVFMRSPLRKTKILFARVAFQRDGRGANEAPLGNGDPPDQSVSCSSVTSSDRVWPAGYSWNLERAVPIPSQQTCKGMFCGPPVLRTVDTDFASTRSRAGAFCLRDFDRIGLG